MEDDPFLERFWKLKVDENTFKVKQPALVWSRVS